MLEDEQAAKDLEEAKRRGDFRQEMETRSISDELPAEAVADKQLAGVLSRPMLTRQMSDRSKQVLKHALTDIPP